MISCSSSGLLVYAALVDLLAEDFLSEEAQHIMTKKNKIVAFTYVLLGGKLHISEALEARWMLTMFHSCWHVRCRRIRINKIMMCLQRLHCCLKRVDQGAASSSSHPRVFVSD